MHLEQPNKPKFLRTKDKKMSDIVDSGESQYLSDVRIVLMGNRAAGKSSAGNTILNREEFDLKRTAQCVKRQREVADRQITVIEAPGWWKNEPVEESPELLKQEILLSVSLCPPGPHAVLLIIRVDTRFTEEEREVLQGYLELLSERVWSHTIVLFTHGDFLLDTSIEQHIESEGEALQWLVEKCGNRYHVLNNKNRSDGTQIKELLEKIEETVAENSGCHLEIDRKILQEMKERRRAEEERAKERMKKMQKWRENIRSQIKSREEKSDASSERSSPSSSISLCSADVRPDFQSSLLPYSFVEEPKLVKRMDSLSLSEDGMSDTCSVGSSTFSSVSTRSAAESSSGCGSSHSEYESAHSKSVEHSGAI